KTMLRFFSAQLPSRLSVVVVVFMLFRIQMMDSRLQFIEQCDDVNKIIGLSTFDDEGSPYYDVFGAEWRTVCGKQAGSVVGNGTRRNPYKIWVNIYKGPAFQEPQCGVKRIGINVFELSVKFIKTCERPSISDNLYRVVCQLNNVPKTHTINRIRPPNQVIANASHVCRPPSTLEFHYSQQFFMPFDIYAIEARKMCSKCSGSGRGRGSYDDPYILTVDFSDPRQWYGCQGTQLEANIYNLKILVQQAEFIVQNSDILYNIVCDFNRNKFRSTNVTSGLTVGG
ncbi:uncharacterized protein LOC118762005, partial [Octopus sinensis]|uniref:Uncharacterized protein LOC118762005 n=1 Tax=Octopus sinensis TaxID=2607531 RepID=A0A7E6EMC7_9MOLL